MSEVVVGRRSTIWRDGLARSAPVRGALWVALSLIAFASLAAYRFAVQTGAFRNSDDAGNFLAGVEMAEGNWNLHGWVMAYDNYYPTEVLGQALLRLLFGYHPIFMQGLEALDWAAIGFVGAFLACFGARTRHLPGIVSIALAMLSFNIFEHQFRDVTIMNIGSHGLTILLTLLTFALVGLAGDHPAWATRGRSVTRLSLLGVIMVAGSFADPVFNVIACLPVLAVSLLGARRRGWQGRAAPILIAIGAIVGGRALVGLMGQTGGFASTSLSVSLAMFPALLDHAAFAGESIARLLGAEFFGRHFGGNLAGGPTIALLRAPLVLMLALAWWRVGADVLGRIERWPDGDPARLPDDLEPLLWFSLTFCVVSTCITTVIIDEPCLRFFLPAAVTGGILAARRFGRSTLLAAYGFGCLLLSIVFGVLLVSHDSPRKVVAIPQIHQLIDVLRQHHLRHGYAGYWEGQIVTALTDREITSIPLYEGDDRRLHPLGYLTNLDWSRAAARDWRGRTFFVSERTDRPGVFQTPEEAVVGEFGRPVERIDLGLFVVSVYDFRDHALTALAP